MVFSLFAILICGIPFSHFLFKPANLWACHGHFFQVMLLGILCASFWVKPRCVQQMNKPLSLFLLWAGLVTSYLWMKIFIQTAHYPVKVFMPFFNLLCFVLFYKLALEYLDKEKLQKIIKWFKYSVLLILSFCILQHFQLDEFFGGLGGGPDQMVGTIGNTSHLAGYLALIQPVFFSKTLLDVLGFILTWVVILLTGSASGVLVGVGVLLFLIWHTGYKQFVRWIMYGMLVFTPVLIKKYPAFFTDSHRLSIWQIAWDKFHVKAITGFGLGGWGLMNVRPETSTWRHIHNDFFQVAFELGIIGLCLLLWCVWDYFRTFRTFKTYLTIRLAGMFFGFCLLAMVSFPGHLWMISIIGMIGYTGIYVAKNEVINAN